MRNRLVEASHRSLFNGDTDWAVDYRYDIFNRRIETLSDADGDGVIDEKTIYAWDGSNVALDFVDSDGDQNGESSASPELTKRYLWGQAVDQLLTQETVDDGGPEDVSYIVRDNLGSTRSLVESSGSVVSTFSYDSYGNVTVPLGSITDTRFLYTCQEYDLQTGLSYYNARWYSPTLGRFISEDPMGFAAGDTNLYRYVGNNTTTYVDPSGLCEESNGGAASDLVFRPGDMPVRAELGNLVFSDYDGMNMAELLNFGTDLVFRPGDMPVKAELENLVFSDYDGMNMAQLLNFGTDLVFRPGETPVTADNGSFDLRSYKDQLLFELLADQAENQTTNKRAKDSGWDELENELVRLIDDSALSDADKEAARKEAKAIAAAIIETFKKCPEPPPRKVSALEAIGNFFLGKPQDDTVKGFFCWGWATAFARAFNAITSKSKLPYFVADIQWYAKGEGANVPVHYWLKITLKTADGKEVSIYVDDGFTRNHPGFVHEEPPIPEGYGKPVNPEVPSIPEKEIPDAYDGNGNIVPRPKAKQ